MTTSHELYPIVTRRIRDRDHAARLGGDQAAMLLLASKGTDVPCPCGEIIPLRAQALLAIIVQMGGRWRVADIGWRPFSDPRTTKTLSGRSRRTGV